jgi:hypothetical protein
MAAFRVRVASGHNGIRYSLLERTGMQQLPRSLYTASVAKGITRDGAYFFFGKSEFLHRDPVFTLERCPK